MSPITQAHFNSNRQGNFALPTDTIESYDLRSKAMECGQFSISEEISSLAMYDISPSWVAIEYSNRDLLPWEAGCTWYSDDPEVLPAIQLRKSFEKEESYLGMYKRDEVLAHEYVHAVRYGLNSTRFEEIFAYLISYSYAKGVFSRILRAFRTALGPIFDKPWESSLLLALLLLSTFSLSLLLLVALFGGYLLGRLGVNWRYWLSCRRHLDALIGKNMALALMVRLTDSEIMLFSRLTPNQIANWIDSQSSNFRWQLLKKAYLFSCTRK